MIFNGLKPSRKEMGALPKVQWTCIGNANFFCRPDSRSSFAGLFKTVLELKQQAQVVQSAALLCALEALVRQQQQLALGSAWGSSGLAALRSGSHAEHLSLPCSQAALTRPLGYWQLSAAGPDLAPCLCPPRQLIQEHTALFASRVFGVLEAVAALDQPLVATLIPTATQALKDAEHKQGLGRNSAHRFALLSSWGLGLRLWGRSSCQTAAPQAKASRVPVCSARAAQLAQAMQRAGIGCLLGV